MKRILVFPAVGLALLVAVFGAFASTASAQRKIVDPNDSWNVGSFPVAGPDVTATASFKQFLYIHGTGFFDPGTKTVNGGGEFEIVTPYADFAGSWQATALLGFVSYGPGHGPSGGKMRVRVSLSGIGSGVLIVSCRQGSPPPSAVEGVKLNLSNGLNFTVPLDGETIFNLP
jgi:hypothetical protein